MLLKLSAGPFGPVSVLPGRSKCRSLTTKTMLFTALEPLGPRNGWSGLLRCCWSVRQDRLGLFRCCQGAQNGRSKPPVQPLGPRNGRLGPPRFWWSAQQGRLGLFGVARALKMPAQSRQCARKGCFRVLTNCCLPACPVGLPGCHLHLPACHSGTLSPASHEVLIF